MNHRLSGLTVLLAVLTATACDQDVPTGPQTVRLAIIEGAAHGGLPFSTPMTQELTTTVTGDPDGTGFAELTINIGQGEFCWSLSAANVLLPATASHIHKAVAGLSGPIVIGLSPPDANGVTSGCSSDVDRDLLKDIVQNSASYYVNVHTSQFPAGAVRGQLGS